MIRLAAVFASLSTLAACGGSTSSPPLGELVDREVFIEAYVDLRVAAVESEDFLVSDEARSEILERHAVDGRALLDFAEVHGADVEFMRRVWNEVERRFEARTRLPEEDER